MDKILLEVVGTQRIDSHRDKMELTTIATLEELEDHYKIDYTEEYEPPAKSVDVCVKINKNEQSVEMTRTGDYSSRLVIEKSRRNLCRYGTEYGDILMGISGHTIDCDLQRDKGTFVFSYDIDINGALASKNEVRLTFKINQE